MRCSLLILLLFTATLKAQDKLFFTSGQVKKGIIVSVAKDAVYFKNTDTSEVQKIKKTELLMTENYKGVRFIFRDTGSMGRDSVKTPVLFKKNSFGVQPLGLMVGRATFVYERYTKNQNIGIAIPFSLTFDPFGSLYNSEVDTSLNAPRRISGVNFIGGLDVNFYFGKKDHKRFFIGPRLRYGTDLFLRGVEAYSLQTQIGRRWGKANGVFSQHFSVGFGFVNVLSTFAGPLIRPNQFYGWYSLNYRLGINW